MTVSPWAEPAANTARRAARATRTTTAIRPGRERVNTASSPGARPHLVPEARELRPGAEAEAEEVRGLAPAHLPAPRGGQGPAHSFPPPGVLQVREVFLLGGLGHPPVKAIPVLGVEAQHGDVIDVAGGHA